MMEFLCKARNQRSYLTGLEQHQMPVVVTELIRRQTIGFDPPVIIAID